MVRWVWLPFGGLHAHMQKTRSWSAIAQRITPWLVIFSGVDDSTRSSNVCVLGVIRVGLPMCCVRWCVSHNVIRCLVWLSTGNFIRSQLKSPISIYSLPSASRLISNCTRWLNQTIFRCGGLYTVLMRIFVCLLSRVNSIHSPSTIEGTRSDLQYNWWQDLLCNIMLLHHLYSPVDRISSLCIHSALYIHIWWPIVFGQPCMNWVCY